MTDTLEFIKVDGTDTRRDIEIYALSTCGFCKRALGFLDSNKIAYRYVHLDELPLETKARVKQELSARFNRQISFPFAIIDGKDYLVGFIEIDWRNTLLGAAANAPR